MPSYLIVPRLLATLILMGALAISACAPKTAAHGNVEILKPIDELTIGVSTREDVRAKLGSPQTTGAFDPNTWYYSGKRTRQWAFFKPDSTGEVTLVLRFDDQGTLREMQDYTEKNRRLVALDRQRTPVQGHSPTFLQQIFGNFGRIAKD